MSLDIETEFPIEIIRTNRRKTASIRIIEGQVQVVVPKRFSRRNLRELIGKRTAWIRKKLWIQSKIIPVKPKEYVSGEAFAYLGKNYRLKLNHNSPSEIKLYGGQLVLGINKNLPNKQQRLLIREQLIRWYRNHAEQKLREKTSRYAKFLGIKPKSISVKEYKSRWGSCSIHGDISYNWKIIIAPQRVIDYVVVHELCHVQQHNHSTPYWKSVERVIPDYKDCRRWLKVNGMRLIV